MQTPAFFSLALAVSVSVGVVTVFVSVLAATRRATAIPNGRQAVATGSMRRALATTSYLTTTAGSRASVRTQWSGHTLSLDLFPQVHGVVAVSMEGTRRTVHGPTTVAMRRSL